MKEPTVEITKRQEVVNDELSEPTWDVRLNREMGNSSLYGVNKTQMLALKEALNNLEVK